ncbi:Actin-2, partial [Taenia solium]
ESSAVSNEAPLKPKVNHEKVNQVKFESFSSLATYAVSQAVLPLCVFSRNTRIVLCYEGYAFPHTAQCFDLVSRGLAHHHVKTTIECSCEFIITAELKIASNGEAFCTALDFGREMIVSKCSLTQKLSYKLPGGQIIAIGNPGILWRH